MGTNQQLLVSMYIYGSYMDTNNRTFTATILLHLATTGTLMIIMIIQLMLTFRVNKKTR